MLKLNEVLTMRPGAAVKCYSATLHLVAILTSEVVFRSPNTVVRIPKVEFPLTTWSVK